jgi:hypothetical protein
MAVVVVLAVALVVALAASEAVRASWHPRKPMYVGGLVLTEHVWDRASRCWRRAVYRRRTSRPPGAPGSPLTADARTCRAAAPIGCPPFPAGYSESDHPLATLTADLAVIRSER